jgi:GWxTD domain-containing protein
MGIEINRYRRSFSEYTAAMIFLVMPWYSILRAEGLKGPETPMKSEGNLVFYTDLYRHDIGDDRILLEVCYSLDLSQLNPVPVRDSKYSFSYDLLLSKLNGEKVKEMRDTKIIPVNDTQTAGSTSFIDMVKFELSPDTLNFSLTLSDQATEQKGSVSQRIAIETTPEKLSISDPIFIAYLSKTADQNNIFTRHNLEMIPNPARYIDTSKSGKSFYIYLEINNLAYDAEKPSLYALTCSVNDLSGRNFCRVEHDQLQKVAANTSRIEKIDLGDLTTGIYVLDLQVVDLGNDHISGLKRYFRVNSGEENASLILPMSEEDVQKYYDQIKYIATRQEMNIFEQLDPVGKQEFLLHFWKQRDPTPDTPENEFMVDHFQRIEYCKKNFPKGINGDRGRVYIKYGPPVDIERYVSSQTYSRPVEIWTYSIQGRVEFVFVDRTNDNNYILVHSTHPDEFSNPGWMNDYKVN